MIDQPDLFSARIARDRAINQVMEHAGDDWRDRALQAFRMFTWRGELVTGEDIRLRITEIAGPPHHHNAWGGFIAGLVKSGLLLTMGETRPMKVVRSHARKTPVYRVR